MKTVICIVDYKKCWGIEVRYIIDNRREDWMGNAATSKGYVEIEVNHELQKKLHFRSWLLGLNFKVHGLCCV